MVGLRLNDVLGLLSPPRCLGCRHLAARDLEVGVCAACRLALASPPSTDEPLPGLGPVPSATDYQGPAVGLVGALKRGSAPAAAATAAELILESWSGPPGAPALVPVAASPSRRLVRGLDPAELIAYELGRRLGLPVVQPLRRVGGRRQRRRTRELRLADPPRFVAVDQAPDEVLLVDDVLTTGGTLISCARAIREAGATRVGAVTFARTPLAASCHSRWEA